MGDNRHEKIQKRAHKIWEREGGAHGSHERHWWQATDEVDREDAESGSADAEEMDLVPPTIIGADLSGPAPSPAKVRKRKAGTISSSDVTTVEALAMRTGITVDQAQDLIDRLGNDRELLEQAARSLKADES